MRILFCNWVDDHDPAGRGGGVRQYQADLCAALAQHDGVTVHSLASGLAHDVVRRAPYWRRSRQGIGGLRFEIVNSAVLAPAHAHFASPAQMSDAPTLAAFAACVEANGPYDIIHFNSLEGLPAEVLALQTRWPGTRFVLALHNYYPFCAQVNLWAEERVPCTGFRGGARCVGCLPVRANPVTVRRAYAVESACQRLGIGPGSLLFSHVLHPAMRLGWRGLKRLKALRHDQRGDGQRGVTGGDGGASPAPAALHAAEAPGWHAARRAGMVALVNRHCAAVLCVSERTREIALHHGVAPEVLQTVHIGSTEASRWLTTVPKPGFRPGGGPLTLGYLGYMRADKGYAFLIDALETLPQGIARRIRLKVAARARARADLVQLRALGARLAGLEHHDGYGRDQLDALLGDVDLGIVPVLWEDNLPQVAIEMHARHVPLICSDRGGAGELGNCPELTFRAGDTADLHRVLTDVVTGRVSPETYWRRARAPLTMHAHAKALLAIYASVHRQGD